MTFQNSRAHGVTPELSQDYAKRTAEQQAAFVMPYLQPGINLLDVGCGPGTISIGLAKAIYAGKVIGIDLDSIHVEEAIASVEEQEVTNITFQKGDALALPFGNCTFDAAFENNVFTHLSLKALEAAKEIFRVLKPGGLFAARDVDADSVVWVNKNDSIKLLDKLFIEWHKSRGSDILIGKHLPQILRNAGFNKTIKSVSADTKGTPESTRSHAKITNSLLDGPFGSYIFDNRLADKPAIERLKESIHNWGEHPDSIFANVHIEVIGWKPEHTDI